MEAGNKLSNFLPKSSHATKKSPPPPPNQLWFLWFPKAGDAFFLSFFLITLLERSVFDLDPLI